MAKGICCALQAQGNLGKPIQLTIHKADGTTIQRCGVCEVRPSCSNPQKKVFAFRFLKSVVCGIAGSSKCTPTAAGITQYNSARTQAATSGSALEVEDTAGYPTLPIPGLGAPARIQYTLP